MMLFYVFIQVDFNFRIHLFQPREGKIFLGSMVFVEREYERMHEDGEIRDVCFKLDIGCLKVDTIQDADEDVVD